MSFPYNPAHEFGTCCKCGEEMVANVPRLSTRGGFVHKSTGKFECQRNIETLTSDARGALREAGWSDADVLRVFPFVKAPEQIGVWREAEDLILCKLPGFDGVRISAQGAQLMIEQLLEVLYGKRAAASMLTWLRMSPPSGITTDPEILARVRELVAHLKDL